MALIIAGDRSGVGKTTVTLAILAFFTQQGNRVQSFKVGPDYIDPMFHFSATGIPCRNLDPVLTSPSYVQDCFKRHAKNANCVVIEGVMGLFDGIRNPEMANSNSLNDYGSTAHIARILSLPVALVLDCSRLSGSIAAIALGYANLDPKVNIAGVILNKVASDRHLELLETALETIRMPVLGVFRRNAAINLCDRHLGLIPSSEIPNLHSTFNQLAELAKTSLEWNQLLPLLNNKFSRLPVSPSLRLSQSPTVRFPLRQALEGFDVAPQRRRTPVRATRGRTASPVRIAIARDKAFNFYYQDNLDILKESGAELIFWSPLEDRHIPNNIQGLYFGGGFPEVFAQQLAENKKVRQELKQIIQAGIPTYAECGGLMYLCQQLIDLNKQAWSMVGVIPSCVTMEAKLTLGYRQATALQTSSLTIAQQTVRGHEFHHSQLTVTAQTPQWQLKGFHNSSHQLTEGWNIKQLHASYLHLHWGEYKFLAQRFSQRCRNYKI